MSRFMSIIIAMTMVGCATKKSTMYIGTYTDGDSEGIYKAQFDASDGTLSEIELAATTVNPSFLVFSPDEKHLYSVNETEAGEVSAFEILKDGKLRFINSMESHGAYPCHITLNNEGDKVAVSNYGGGNVSIYTLGENGSLQSTLQVFDHNIPEIKSHAHSAKFFGDVLYVSDLGRNNLFKYEWNDTDKKFELVTDSLFSYAENSGPRHFILMNNGKSIYSLSEYANTVTYAKKNGDDFKVEDVYGSLSSDFEGESFGADIHASSDGKFVYASNRGENAIAVFKRNTNDGSLELIQNAKVQGNWPRNFVIDPSGKYLLVANQRSNSISVLKIDPNAGTLTFQKSLDFPSPVCLLFK